MTAAAPSDGAYEVLGIRKSKRRHSVTSAEIVAAVKRAERDAARSLPEYRTANAYNHLLGALSVLVDLDINQIRADIAAGVVA
jgi:hypothetical protein